MPMGKAMSKGVIVCDELSKALVLSIKKFAYLKNDNKLKLKMIAIISQDFFGQANGKYQQP